MEEVEEIRKKIVSLILSKPAQDWIGFGTDLNGISIQVMKYHASSRAIFKIGDIELYDDRIEGLYWKLTEIKEKEERNTELALLIELHNKLS